MSSAVQDAANQRTRVGAPCRPRVLVVDDNPMQRRFAGGLAERGAGMHAIYAGNGVEAMEAIGRESPAVVVTDLQMPGMDGLQLVEAIRAHHSNLPVILMTAQGSEDLAVRALRAGAASYVPKSDLARHLAPTLTQILAATAAGDRRRRLLGHLEERESRFRLINDPDLVAELIGFLREELDTLGFGDETDRTRVAVAIQEAASNALYHGNLEVSSDLRGEDERQFYALADERRTKDPYRNRRIGVHAKVGAGEARIVIRDEGSGFDTSRLDRQIEPEDLMRIGGRGLLLIRAFMDEVAFNEVGNQITMVKWH